MRITRLRIIGAVVSVLLTAAIIRLAWLMFMPWETAHQGKAAIGRPVVQQRSHRLLLDTGRGDFVDRNGLALTGFSYEALAIFPYPQGGKPRGSGRDLNALARIMGISRQQLQQKLDGAQSPEFWLEAGSSMPHQLSAAQLKELSSLKLEGVAVLPYRSHTDEFGLHIQAIGYISENPQRMADHYNKQLNNGKATLREKTGGGGLEMSLDTLLRGTGPVYASSWTDAAGNPLKGLGLTMNRPSNPMYPLRVETTLSLPLQAELERQALAAGLGKGAIVVLDARTADILATVSLPVMKDVASPELFYDGAANRAVRAYTPGSIFKLVTEAAALEAGVADEDEVFHCDGEYGHYGLSCWKEGGHGAITLREGLAQSCNIVFAALAEKLQPQQLERTADKLGLGRRIGWNLPKGDHEGALKGPLRLLWEEESGGVFAKDTIGPNQNLRTSGALARTGIGQQDVLLTPLQGANLIVTLLHNGKVAEPRLVTGIRYANGQKLAGLGRHVSLSAYGQISPSTATALRKGMEEVVTAGTGQRLQGKAWKLAGKSGTAQTGAAGTGNHQWFIGYGPVSTPRYAVAVIAENRPEGSANLAAKVFGGVMETLAAWEASETDRLP
ncbi:peptidoglycan D,D-transpeptidase FtsI family protein [Paenibacillus herberti]|uniref:Penicillin-binding protein n=1 Tax=Paenibacillus herberti TaxID=1619309 RepID=A0A229P007_9BACL|nr:penicillin-binding transpeptidase domain-containing protein [Paenibacillus herberti]OXM15428.1 penicillin-binding protein [Paenibacillus herberti]